MITVRPISDQYTAHQARLDLAASFLISAGNVKPPPPILPLKATGAFPPSTWHSSLPPTGLKSLESWTHEGLSPENQIRIGKIISVYSLGFHQLIRGVRAGMTSPSSTVANLWKMFVFLLNDCMPDGSIYLMKIATMEREQTRRARELTMQREAELSKLMAMENELQETVRKLDLALRNVQAHRQEAEDARLEALDSIDEQETLQLTTAEEINDLESQANKWQIRFQSANNRSRMLAEDIRQYQRKEYQLKIALYKAMDDYNASEEEDAKVKQQFDSLTYSFESLQEKHRRLLGRQSELNQACARSSQESQELSLKLIQLGGKVGELTITALNKITERILVVKEVEKIQQELHKSAMSLKNKTRVEPVLTVEIGASAVVSNLIKDREVVLHNLNDLSAMRNKLLQQAGSLQADIARTKENHLKKEEQIKEQEAKIEEMKEKKEGKLKLKKTLDGELEVLQQQIDVDEGNIAQAEKRLASAMTAVQALTDIIRNTKAENKSLLREIRVLESHREQLTEDIKVHTNNIEHHQSIVEARIATLKDEIRSFDERIVAAAELSKRHQEEAVKFKQAQHDCATAIVGAGLELARSKGSVTEQQAELTRVEGLAQASEDKRLRLETELGGLTRVRDIGLQALNRLHETHDQKMKEMQTEVVKLEEEIKEKQYFIAATKQHMHALTTARHELESQHESELMKIHQDTKAVEMDYHQFSDTHTDWLNECTEEQNQLQAKLKEIHEKTQAAQKDTKSLNDLLTTAVAKRHTQREQVEFVQQQLDDEKKANAEKKSLVTRLVGDIEWASKQRADHVYLDSNLQVRLQTTQTTNTNLETRHREYIERTRNRQVRNTQTVQTINLPPEESH